MMGRSPTITSVNVVLKSSVLAQVEGSRYVFIHLTGTSLLLALDPDPDELLLLLLLPELCFEPRTAATMMMIRRITAQMPPMIPRNTVSKLSE
jgi:hypothetical protein